MSIARCKFRVSEVTQPDRRDASWEKVKLQAQYDENDPEDTRFAKATPSGQMEFVLSNPNLLGKLKQGQVYYVDLTPVE